MFVVVAVVWHAGVLLPWTHDTAQRKSGRLDHFLTSWTIQQERTDHYQRDYHTLLQRFLWTSRYIAAVLCIWKRLPIMIDRGCTGIPRIPYDLTGSMLNRKCFTIPTNSRSPDIADITLRTRHEFWNILVVSKCCFSFLKTLLEFAVFCCECWTFL